MAFYFGIGSLHAVPVGAAAGNETPVKFGTIKDISLDISRDIKELQGQNFAPDALRGGKLKITGKASSASINGAAFNNLFFGATMAAGMTLEVDGEAHTVPAATPFTVAVAPPGSGTFAQDLGVTYANGAPLALVASSPTQGEYSVSGGTYTFSTGDASAAILIDYSYTAATTGKNIAVNNAAMGPVPGFEVHVVNEDSGNTLGWKLYYCVASKLGLALKQEDFLIPEFDFTAGANASGQILYIPTSV